MSTANPFDPQALRLSPAQVSGMVRKQTLTVPVTKPPKQDWIRTRWDPDSPTVVGLLELKDDREAYAVLPGVFDALAFECSRVALVPYINRAATLRLWPLKVPGADGRESDWHTSARMAAVAARDEWIRVYADMSAGSYAYMQAEIQPPEPVWPETTLEEMMTIAFRNGARVIDSLDHPVIKILQAR
jgi:hypothetical protein